MREYTYDLHTHSCLSPCGDEEMTPNNLVNMAALSGCEIMAITDHNSCKNAPAAVKVGEQAGILVIPGMELCVAEEAHIVCLFETLEGAMAFDSYVYDHMPKVQNKTEIFGEQKIMNEEDEWIGTEENLLIISSFIGVNEVLALTRSYGGIAFPAHVNRDSFSVIASLGSLPPEAGFTAAEITRDCDFEALVKRNPELSQLLILRDSDSHYLESLSGEPERISLPEKSIKAVLRRIAGEQ